MPKTPKSPAPKTSEAERKPEQQTRRVTVDLPLDLHKRVRHACVESDTDMATELRRIIAENFPAST